MRQNLIRVLVALVMLPTLLIFNESDTIVPNLLGLAYATMLVMVARRARVQNWLKHIYDIR